MGDVEGAGALKGPANESAHNCFGRTLHDGRRNKLVTLDHGMAVMYFGRGNVHYVGFGYALCPTLVFRRCVGMFALAKPGMQSKFGGIGRRVSGGQDTQHGPDSQAQEHRVPFQH
jgi:hypothetical protein